MHIMITADTKEELERTKVSLKSTLEAMEMRAIPLRFEQEKVLKHVYQYLINKILKIELEHQFHPQH